MLIYIEIWLNTGVTVAMKNKLAIQICSFRHHNYCDLVGCFYSTFLVVGWFTFEDLVIYISQKETSFEILDNCQDNDQ